MKAIVWTKYGPPEALQLQKVETPTPQDNELLIKVHAATVTAGDCELRGLTLAPLFRLPLRLYAGWLRPRRITILGQELAGEVAAVGKNVTQFQPGDAVFAATGFKFGAYAEYICLPDAAADGLVWPRPTNMSYEEAATIPTGGLNAMHFLRKGQVQPGERVLINGAGGSIGTYGVQIAKAWGAEVTAVDYTNKLDMLRSIGADQVIDFTQEDFTRRGEQYDVVIDVVGKSSFSRTLRSLRRNGRYILGNLSLSGMFRAVWTNRTTNKQVIFEAASYQPEDVRALLGLIEAGQIKVVIDRRYPLADTAVAHRYVESGQKKGNVIITVVEGVRP
ncbi:MAG TPA: NAD(P)-dependent alcohol dehydrogenase [Chloroflexota bacterium]|nr:NAD(P)-dependent alcohol dehydrogenase [Chloroflexota bacterium]